MKLQIIAGLMAAIIAVPVFAGESITPISSLLDIDFATIPDNAFFTIEFNLLMRPTDMFLLNKRSEKAFLAWQSVVDKHPELTQEDWEKVAVTASLGTVRQSPDEAFIQAIGNANQQRGVKTIVVDGYVFTSLDKMQVNPTVLVVVDSSLQMLECIKAECEERGITFKGYVCDIEPVKEWNDALVRFQLEYAIDNHEWLSDEEAYKHIADQQ